MAPHSRNKTPFRVLKFNDIPMLPPPSIELLEILNSEKVADPTYSPRRLRSRKRKPKINGFIAFRSFHSRAIKNTRKQQEISSSLAKVWEVEPNREVWNYYALLYNETAKGEEFISWLYRNLGMNDDANCSIKQISKVKKTHFLSKIEDVFIQSSQSSGSRS